jgi:ribosomal protein S18 acetylase RimI-like enzyme
MTVTVRPAHTDELGVIGNLTARAYAADGFVDAEDPYADHLREAATRSREAEVYVALVGNKVAGTVTFCREGSAWSEIAQPGEGEFRMLAVAPEHRRRGVAAALVAVCVERSRELGYDAVVLSSLAVQQPAHRLYERLGFLRVPERDWSPHDGVDLQAFRLLLSD